MKDNSYIFWPGSTIPENGLDAIILAGGDGNRFKENNISEKKPFAPLFGKPIIFWIIRDLFGSNQIKNIRVILKKPLRSEQETMNKLISLFGSRLNFSIQSNTDGILNGLLECTNDMRGYVLIVNGDTLLPCWLPNLQNEETVFASKRKDDCVGGCGKIIASNSGNLISIIRTSGKEKKEFSSSTGMYILQIERMKEKIFKNKFSSIDDYLSNLCKNLHVKVKDLKTYFCDIGTPFGYKKACTDINLIKKSFKMALIDRDGTLNINNGHLTAKKNPEIIKKNISQINNFNGNFNLVVSNQSAIARGLITVEELYEFTKKLEELLSKEGLLINGWMYCPHHFNGEKELGYACNCRKPNNLMLEDALSIFGIEREKTLFFGDSESDRLAAYWSKINFILV